MAEDTRDFIERTQSRSVNYLGRELSPAEMASEFAKWDMDTRVTALEEMKTSGPSELTPRQLGEQLAYMRGLVGTHERLRKAGR